MGFRLWALGFGLVLGPSLLMAQQPPDPPAVTVRGQTYTPRSILSRNMGTDEDQTTAFTPHKIAGNVYYVGTRTLSSFLITTPECWVPPLGDAQHGFPYLSGAGRLVLKDAIMMGAALVTMADSAKAYLRKQASASPVTDEEWPFGARLHRIGIRSATVDAGGSR